MNCADAQAEARKTKGEFILDSQETAYSYIHATIKGQIISGQLLPGSRLPSSRMLCKEFHVGIPTITKVFNTLKEEGLVDILPRRAPIVRNTRNNGKSDRIPFILARHDLILQIHEISALLLPYLLTFASSNYDVMLHPDFKKAEREAKKGNDASGSRLILSLCKDILSYGGNPLLSELYGIFELYSSTTFFFDESPFFQNICLSKPASITGLITEALGLSNPEEKLHQLQKIYTQINEAVKISLAHYATAYETLPSQVSFTFNWNPARTHNHYYSRVIQDLMRKIGTGQYPPNTYLPAQSHLAKEYQVSVSTIRAALAQLNNMGLCQTINGKGTIVQIPNPASALSFIMAAPTKKDSLLYLYALQTMILLLYPTALYTAPNFTATDLNYLAGCFQETDTIFLEKMMELLLKRLNLSPLRTALAQTGTLTDWSFHLACCLKGRKQTIYYLNNKIQGAYQYLCRHNYNSYANQLTDCYRYLLETARQYMTDRCNLPEAQSVYTPFV